MKFINKFSLSDKVIIITGGSGFLGKQFATAIASASGTPVLLDINYNKALLICKNLKKNFGVNALAIKCDVTKEDKVKKALKIIKNQLRGDQRMFQQVPDYSIPNVSDKVVRIIHSYTDYVNRVVWKSF